MQSANKSSCFSVTATSAMLKYKIPTIRDIIAEYSTHQN